MACFTYMLTKGVLNYRTEQCHIVEASFDLSNVVIFFSALIRKIAYPQYRQHLALVCQLCIPTAE